MIPIVPALIPKDEVHIKTTLQQLAFSHEVHLDVVDGQFVATSSWPYTPVGKPSAIRHMTDQFTLEVDLMVADPLPAAEAWVAAGADMLVLHLETISLDDFKGIEAFARTSVGISAHGETTIDALLEYAQYADYIQLMGIYEIGAQGQPFDESVLDKIGLVKSAFPDKPLTVDGSVNAETISRLAQAGADRFIVGSAITLQPDPEAAHTALSVLINE